MYTLVAVIILIVCVLLILIVLVQNSKGGGLASNFQSSNQVMGVRKTTDFLEKATWGLAGFLLFLTVLSAAFIERGEEGVDQSLIQNQIENEVDPNQIPSFPTAAPETKTTTPAETTDGGAE